MKRAKTDELPHADAARPSAGAKLMLAGKFLALWRVDIFARCFAKATPTRT